MMFSLGEEKIGDQVGAEAKKQAESHSAGICDGGQEMPAAQAGESGKAVRCGGNGSAGKNMMHKNQKEGQKAHYVEFRPITMHAHSAGVVRGVRRQSIGRD